MYMNKEVIFPIFHVQVIETRVRKFIFVRLQVTENAIQTHFF